MAGLDRMSGGGTHHGVTPVRPHRLAGRMAVAALVLGTLAAMVVLGAVVWIKEPLALPLLGVPLGLSYYAFRAQLQAAADRDRMRNLYEAGRTLLSPITRATDFRPFLERVQEMLSAPAAEIVLVEGGEVAVHDSEGGATFPSPNGWGEGEGEKEKAAWSGKYVRTREGLIPHVAAIGRDSGPYGVLVVHREKGLSRSERSFLDALASQLSVKLEDQHLYREMLEHRTRLEEIIGHKADFVATVSHELRTPLTPLKGFLMSLLGGTAEDSPEARQEYFQIMLNQTERLEHLVTDLLEMSRIESGRPVVETRAVELATLLHEQVREIAEQQPGRLVEVEIPEEPVLVHADGFRVAQVLTNLISNGLKYSPASDPVEVRLAVEADRAVVSVQDHGEGIPPSEQGRVFDRFYRVDSGLTRRTGGTGLGLYIAKRLVEAMEGRLWVASSPGEGATFSFSLPLAPAGSRFTEAGSPSEVSLGDSEERQIRPA